MSKRAIISVSDKAGLLELGGALVGMGWELVASGGTARALAAAAIPVRDVADITGAPEMLGGRVKTLHPAIHAGILARGRADDLDELARAGIAPIDLVVCNLYPFSETVGRDGVTLEEAVEQIDIGGVTLLRAAAKNFERVTVVCDPADYGPVVDQVQRGGVSPELRRALAHKAFAHTRDYDAAIAAHLEPEVADGAAVGEWPQTLSMNLTHVQALRYGENPHQSAALYAPGRAAGPLGGRLLGGKELSYNNLLDLDAAWRAAEAYDTPAVVIVKHLSPCGIAISGSVAAALPAAIASDPVSAFGGVVAANRPIDGSFIEALDRADLFIEAIIAPDFKREALEWLAAHKKNCRLVSLAGTPRLPRRPVEYRTVRGGLLVQTRDAGDAPEQVWRVVSRRQPAAAEWAALRFAWEAVKHVKSNAIVLAHEEATVGIGGGLSSRVDAVRLAVGKAGERAQGAVMASDAFFPFSDGIEVAAAAGVVAVVEPGGSVRDDEVIAAADRLDLVLVFTGARHFRH